MLEPFPEPLEPPGMGLCAVFMVLAVLTIVAIVLAIVLI